MNAAALFGPSARCVCCGRGPEHITIDHTIPRSMGGPDTLGNVNPRCSDCNNVKSQLERGYAEEYRLWTNEEGRQRIVREFLEAVPNYCRKREHGLVGQGSKPAKKKCSCSACVRERMAARAKAQVTS